MNKNNKIRRCSSHIPNFSLQLTSQPCPRDRHTLMVGTPIRKGSFFKNLSPILPEPKLASCK